MKKTQHQAFLEHYRLIHDSFVRYCSSRAFGIMETEDLVQEAVLAALDRFDKIINKEKLLSYMIGTVHNIIRNKRRQAKFKGYWDEDLLQKLESKTPDPEVALDIQFLLKAIDQLPERQKQAILLFEISGFSIREISEIQDSSEMATKTRLSRARQKLRKQFKEQPRKKPLAESLTTFASILL